MKAAKHIIISGILITLIILFGTSLTAQEITETPGASIELTGAVSSMSDTTMTVNGLTINITGAAVSAGVNVGVTVTINGQLTADGVIIAQSVTLPAATPVATSDGSLSTRPTDDPAATEVSEGDVIIVIEGPIQNININIITIYNINIEVDINNPILNIIQIGDVIYVEGIMGADGLITASLINNLTGSDSVSDGASVGIQGPIEAIDGNLVTVNGIIVQFDPNDPMLSTLAIGDFLDVQGNIVIINNVYILIVINVIIINNINVGIPDWCWWHADGMGMGMGMGHWHCDGMGMGMGMGMGR